MRKINVTGMMAIIVLSLMVSAAPLSQAHSSGDEKKVSKSDSLKVKSVEKVSKNSAEEEKKLSKPAIKREIKSVLPLTTFKNDTLKVQAIKVIEEGRTVSRDKTDETPAKQKADSNAESNKNVTEKKKEPNKK